MVLLPLRAGFCQTARHVHGLAVTAFVAHAGESRAENSDCRVCRVLGSFLCGPLEVQYHTYVPGAVHSICVTCVDLTREFC